MEGEGAGEPASTVSGILIVNHLHARILFDSNATQSFVNFEFARKLTSKPDEVDIQLYVTTPSGTIYHTELIIRDCAVNVEGKTLSANFVQVEMQRWDIILGMDWLAKHKVTTDCEKKLITFSTPKGKRMEFKGNGC